MGMPNDVRLTFATVSKRFVTLAVLTTTHQGGGTHGIVAQVTIPANLPMYGTVAFTSHTIEMTLGEAFVAAKPQTAVTLLAHELSHVLLHALRHHNRDIEQFTDLVPLVLGFTDIVGPGRVSTVSEEIGNVVRTSTLTYGYLSDAEFSLARQLVATLGAESQRRRQVLSAAIHQLRCVVDSITARAQMLVTVLRVLDELEAPVSPNDGPRLVALHDSAYSDDLHRELERSKKLAAEATVFAEALSKPSAKERERVDKVRRALNARVEHLRATERQLGSDLRLVIRNQPRGHRIRWTVADATSKGVAPPGQNRAPRRIANAEVVGRSVEARCARICNDSPAT
jgi:hypothetical protein